jgi:hypothetical protein
MRFVARLVALAGIAVLAAATVKGTGLDDLRAMATERRLRLGAVQLTFTVKQDVPQGAAPTRDTITSISRSMLLDLDRRRFRMDRQCEFFGGEFGEPAVFTDNGEVASVLLSELLLGTVDSKQAVDGRSEAQALTLMMVNPPRPGGRGFDDGSLESFLQTATLRPDTDEVEGRPCFVVDHILDGVLYATVWLDTEHDLLPMKSVSFRADGTEVCRVMTTRMAPFRTSSGGELWLPLAWETEAWIGDAPVHNSVETDPESVVIGASADDSQFEPYFPPGTTVADHIAHLLYRVSETGEVVPIGQLDAGGQVDLRAANERPIDHAEPSAQVGGTDDPSTDAPADRLVVAPQVEDSGDVRVVTPSPSSQASSLPAARTPRVLAPATRSSGVPDGGARRATLPRRGPTPWAWGAAGAAAGLAALGVWVSISRRGSSGR